MSEKFVIMHRDEWNTLISRLTGFFDLAKGVIGINALKMSSDAIKQSSEGKDTEKIFCIKCKEYDKKAIDFIANSMETHHAVREYLNAGIRILKAIGKSSEKDLNEVMKMYVTGISDINDKIEKHLYPKDTNFEKGYDPFYFKGKKYYTTKNKNQSFEERRKTANLSLMTKEDNDILDEIKNSTKELTKTPCSNHEEFLMGETGQQCESYELIPSDILPS